MCTLVVGAVDQLADRDAAERHLPVRLEFPLFAGVALDLGPVDLPLADVRLAWLNAATTAGSPSDSSAIRASQLPIRSVVAPSIDVIATEYVCALDTPVSAAAGTDNETATATSAATIDAIPLHLVVWPIPSRLPSLSRNHAPRSARPLLG
jgi:hypothetical protein